MNEFNQIFAPNLMEKFIGKRSGSDYDTETLLSTVEYLNRQRCFFCNEDRSDLLRVYNHKNGTTTVICDICRETL